MCKKTHGLLGVMILAGKNYSWLLGRDKEIRLLFSRFVSACLLVCFVVFLFVCSIFSIVHFVFSLVCTFLCMYFFLLLLFFVRMFRCFILLVCRLRCV